MKLIKNTIVITFDVEVELLLFVRGLFQLVVALFGKLMLLHEHVVIPLEQLDHLFFLDAANLLFFS